jgi:DNA-binding transcriptional regulator GbsR (MarR family)
MTEITDKIDRMPAALQRFILKWGDMGSQWGVNRSVAQIHALLYISEKPLCAEEISHILGIARSNVSNSLKELQSWRIIERIPIPGDRRDHFSAEMDVWDIAVRITAVRKQREIDPALETLDLCVEEAADDPRVSVEQRKRIQDMQRFVRTMDHWYSQMLALPSATLLRLVSLGKKKGKVA